MPELTVDSFRKTSPSGEASQSTEAPKRPSVMSVGLQDPYVDPELPDMEILDDEETTVPYNKEAPLPAVIPPRNPYSKVNFDRLESRRELMQALHDIIPLNEFNLPRYFFRADLIDLTTVQEAYHSQFERASTTAATPTATISLPEQAVSQVTNLTVQDHLDAAITHLEYVHGYPTFRSGLPFWSQMPHETKEAFSAFCEYLTLPGVRILANVQQFPVDVCSEFFQLYYWHFRATAFDMYRKAHHDRMRVERIMSTEDNHYLESEKIFRRITKALGSKGDEELAEIEPEKLINMLTKVAQLQRVSAGLHAHGGQVPTNDAPVNVEVRMKQIASENVSQQKVNETVDSDLLLADPSALETAQELILKIGRG